MKLSTRSRYGLKAVVDLAAVYGGGILTLKELAENQDISEAYLERLLRQLRTAGILDTVRGANGGYFLKIPPQDLSVERVMEVLEGSTTIVDCVGKHGSICKNACLCSARPLFLTLQKRIDEVLTNTTIQDLLNDNLEQKRRMKHANGLS